MRKLSKNPLSTALEETTGITSSARFWGKEMEEDEQKTSISVQKNSGKILGSALLKLIKCSYFLIYLFIYIH